MRIPFSASFNSRSKSGMTQHVKKSTSLGLIVILILTTFLPILGFITPSLNPVQASSDWWNEDYRYRQVITITNLTPQTNVYHQLQLDTSDGTRFKGDCTDIRFLTQSGQEIPYHIVSGCTTSNTQVQLLFASLPHGDQDIYLYYGNPQATNTAVQDPFSNPATGVTTNTQPEQTSPAPVAHWKFDEGYGSTTNSSTPTNYPGIINGATWQQEDMCPSGKCLYFDGVDDYVETADIGIGSNNQLTLSAWIKYSSCMGDGYYCYIITKSRTFNQSPYTLAVDNLGHIIFGRSNTPIVGTQAGFNDNSWHLAVATIEGNSLRFYVDGILQGSKGISPSINTVNVSLGGSGEMPTYRPYKGFLDDIKIYSYTRTQQQIQQDYVRGIQSLNQQQANLSNGLVGHWKMDEASWNGSSGEVKDSSGNGNHGQALGGATIEAGKYSSGGNFNGTDGHLMVAHNQSTSFTDAVTVSAWIKPAAHLSGVTHGYDCHSSTIVSKHSSGGCTVDNWGIGYGYYPGLGSWDQRVSMQYPCSGSWCSIAKSTAQVPIGTFAHIAWVLDRQAGTSTLYINGQQDSQISGLSIDVLTNNYPIAIGTSRDGANNYFSGIIDQTYVFNRALNSTEVTQLYNLAPKPVACYDFEEGSGSTVYDKSGNNLSGQTINDPAYVSGKQSKALNFNGQDTYVDVPSDNLLKMTAGISLSVWIKSNANSDYSTIISKDSGSGTGYPQYVLDLNSAGRLRFFGYDTTHTAGGNNGNVGPDLRDSTWHFVSGTFDGVDQWNLYLDGRLIHTATFSPVGGLRTSDQRLSFGIRGTNSRPFNGSLDEVKIYNYARSQLQIIEDMQGGATNNPMIQYGFNEGEGVIAHNKGWTGATHDGTLGCTGGTCTAPQWTTNGKDGRAIYSNPTIVSDRSWVSAATANIPSRSGESVTLSAWLNPDATQINNGWFIRNGAGGINDENYGLSLGSPSGGKYKISFEGHDGTGYRAVATTNYVVPANSWTHVAAVFTQGVGVKIYANGNLVQNLNYPYITAQASSRLWIGGHSGGFQSFNGYIDEVKIYPGTLTPQQISIDYNQSSASIIGGVSTEPTTSGSGQTATQPSNFQDAKYCVPGSIDYCAKPIIEYDFEEGSGGVVKNIAENANNGAWYGAGQHYNLGKFGKGGLFNGTDDYIGTPLSVGNTDSLTYGAWFKWDGRTGFNTLFGTLSSNNGTIRLESSDGTVARLSAYWETGSSTQYSPNIAINRDQWYYLSVVKISGSLNFYLNGTLDWSPGIVDQQLQNLTIGRQGINSSRNWSGLIDQVRIYNYARTPAQIAWDYNNGKPIARYKLDECQGTAIHDSSGHGLHGSLNLGASDITTPGTCSSSGAWNLGKLGKYNSAISFDGIDDYVSIPNNAALNFGTRDFTLSAWIKWGGGKESPGVISKNSNPNGIKFRMNGDGFTLGILSEPPWQYYNSATIKLDDNVWHHILVTADRDGLATFYADGLRLSSVDMSNTSHINITNTQSLKIGDDNFCRSSYCGYFDGLIDDVQIYNYALTQKQIDTLYNGGAVRWGQ